MWGNKPWQLSGVNKTNSKQKGTKPFIMQIPSFSHGSLKPLVPFVIHLMLVCVLHF
jgi:hypothetical protein